MFDRGDGKWRVRGGGLDVDVRGMYGFQSKYLPSAELAYEWINAKEERVGFVLPLDKTLTEISNVLQ